MKQYELTGMVINVNEMVPECKRLVVGVSNDKIGRSLSIIDEDTGIMYQIPFEPIADALRRD